MSVQLVVDCSVATKWVLPEFGSDLALQLLEQHELGEVSLIAPDLLLAEFASLVAKRSRRKEISTDQAVQALWKGVVQSSLTCAHDFDMLLSYRCISNCHFGIAFTSLSQSNTTARSSLPTSAFLEVPLRDILRSGSYSRDACAQTYSELLTS